MTKVTKKIQGSDLQPLTQSLRGEVDPWETLPLNNSPFLIALVLRHIAEMVFSLGFRYAFLAQVKFYHAARG